MRILLVDDSATMRRIQKTQLMGLGLTDIVEAENGKAGYDALTGDPKIEMVFLDWNMPEMDFSVYHSYGEADPALCAMDDLGGHEHHAERDRCFDRRLGHVHQPQRRRRERDAVRDREGRDRRDESPPVADQEHQAEHEQQVVNAEQDVFDAEHEVGLCNLEAARCSSDLE